MVGKWDADPVLTTSRTTALYLYFGAIVKLQ